jgi:hypothetical protein
LLLVRAEGEIACRVEDLLVVAQRTNGRVDETDRGVWRRRVETHKASCLAHQAPFLSQSSPTLCLQPAKHIAPPPSISIQLHTILLHHTNSTLSTLNIKEKASHANRTLATKNVKTSTRIRHLRPTSRQRQQPRTLEKSPR